MNLYKFVSLTVFFTAANVFSSEFFSASVRLNSIIFSIPPDPITVGTPIKNPSTPNSPSHNAAQGITLFLSLRYASAISIAH